MTTEDIRKRVEENAEGDVLFGRDEVAELLDEVDHLKELLHWDDRLVDGLQADCTRQVALIEALRQSRPTRLDVEQTLNQIKVARDRLARKAEDETGPSPSARAVNVSIPHDAEIIRGWAEEVQARGMRSDHIYELADAVLTLLDQRDRLDEIRQQDRRFIKGLQSDRDQLLENYRVLTRRYDLLEAELARERARLARKVEAVRALHGHSIDPNECMECDMSADAHQLAPRGFPCRTLAALASTDGSEQ
jgi:hypothetical protein